MSEKKPEPLNPTKTPDRCPVCGEVSYSLGGVHPQCSVRQADAKRTDRLKLEKLAAQADTKTEKPGAQGNRAAAWQKSCPKCNAFQHVRKTVCDCGHVFTIRAGPPTSEGEPT
jgi:hypothetical protein